MGIAAFVRIFKLNKGSPTKVSVRQAEVGMSYILGDITIAHWFIHRFIKKFMNEGLSESDGELTEDLDSSDQNCKNKAANVKQVEEINLNHLL